MLSLRNSLIAVGITIAAGLSIWVANAALTQVTIVYTIDENDPAATSTPAGDECPVGMPCKLQSVLNVGDVNQPADSLTSISPGAFQGAAGPSIPNGTLVGNTHVVTKYALLHCTDIIKAQIDKTADFLDGGIKAEVADDGSQEALGNPTVWPTRVESDLRVAYLLSTGHQIVRRSVAVIAVDLPDPFPDFQMPINLLAFDVSDGNGFGGLTIKGIYNVAVAGDPSVPPPTTGAMCTPMTSTGLLLGQTAAGLTLQTCQESGTHTLTSVLTREVDGALQFDATVSDTIRCMATIGGMAEYPDVETGPAASAHSSSGPSAPAVAGIATGALLLAAGGWYARRRWLT